MQHSLMVNPLENNYIILTIFFWQEITYKKLERAQSFCHCLEVPKAITS
jgi:hypothetical protein